MATLAGLRHFGAAFLSGGFAFGHTDLERAAEVCGDDFYSTDGLLLMDSVRFSTHTGLILCQACMVMNMLLILGSASSQLGLQLLYPNKMLVVNSHGSAATSIVVRWECGLCAEDLLNQLTWFAYQ